VKYYDLAALKAHLPEYLRAIGTQVFMKGEHQLTTACPIHQGTKRNFHAILKPDGAWVWTCRSGCGGDGGTVLDLHAQLHGLHAKSADCIPGAAGVLNVLPGDKPISIHTVTRHREQRRRATRQRAIAEERQRTLTTSITAKRAELLDPYLSNDWRADFFDELAGPAGAGKSLIAHITRQALGGRSANPMTAWTGRLPWNDNLIAAELLLIDDSVASTDPRARKAFGAYFKEAIHAGNVTINTRRKTSFDLRPVWHVMVCCNETPENLSVIPPLEDGIEDKIILLKVAPIKTPMPACTVEEILHHRPRRITMDACRRGAGDFARSRFPHDETGRNSPQI